MPDKFSKSQRSEIMAKVSGSDTKPEISIRKELFKRGFRYRKNDKRYPGKPDIVLPKFKTIIFVHGCFWHSHDKCGKSKRPSSNIDYWQKKLNRNIARDAANLGALKKMGWKVIIVWECEIKTQVRLLEKIEQLQHEINPQNEN